MTALQNAPTWLIKDETINRITKLQQLHKTNRRIFYLDILVAIFNFTLFYTSENNILKIINLLFCILLLYYAHKMSLTNQRITITIQLANELLEKIKENPE